MIRSLTRTLILALLLPAGAAAQDADTGAEQETAGAYPGLPGVEYFCTDSRGGRMELGETLCITAGCNTWMARCEMAVNNNLAMWRKLQDGCPGASLPGQRLVQLAQPPV